jgi:hypothetical protein
MIKRLALRLSLGFAGIPPAAKRNWRVPLQRQFLEEPVNGLVLLAARLNGQMEMVADSGRDTEPTTAFYTSAVGVSIPNRRLDLKKSVGVGVTK